MGGDAHTPKTNTATLYQELESKLNNRHGKRREKNPTSSTSGLVGQTLDQKHIHITTSFCHPIAFNYIPDPLLKFPCNWCESPLFGLFGLADHTGPKTVEGFYWPDGRGFEEIFGGYSELGYSASKMCVSCTFERVRIRGCAGHELRRLGRGEIDFRGFDDEEWFKAERAIRRGDVKGGELILGSKWCSICPQLARFICCSNQTQGGGGGEEGGGCGLLLCEECEVLLKRCVKGGAKGSGAVLDAMVRTIKSNGWMYNMGVRADAEFLTGTGELMVRLEKGMGSGRLVRGGATGLAGSLGGASASMNGVMGGGKGKGKEREWTEFENPYRLKAELNQRESIRRGGNQILKRSGPVGLGLSFGEELLAPGKGRQEKIASLSGERTGMRGQKAASFGENSRPNVTGIGGQQAAGFGGRGKLKVTGMAGQKAASFGGEGAPRVTGMGCQKAASFGGIGNREFIDLTSDEDN
jgi:hypothetical protein